MKVLLIVLMLVISSMSYAYSPLQEALPSPDQQPCRLMDCPLPHKPGYFFTRACGRYYPDYQYPQFYRNQYCWRHPCPGIQCKPVTIKRAFYRTYTREGISEEHYIAK